MMVVGQYECEIDSSVHIFDFCGDNAQGQNERQEKALFHNDHLSILFTFDIIFYLSIIAETK